jgi:hypothetical protein
MLVCYGAILSKVNLELLQSIATRENSCDY